MPSIAVYDSLTIYKALKNFKIFHDNGKLKTEAFLDEDGKTVWDKALHELPLMKRHNLYCNVQKNIGNVKTWLKAFHFPKADQALPVDVEDVVAPTFEDSNHEEYKHNDVDTEETKNEEIVKVDEYLPLHEMKYSFQFAEIIQRISIMPFYVTYWSVQQRNIFKDIVKMKEYSICVTILKDILPSIQLKNYTSRGNSLVAITGIVSDTPIPLAHLITETFDEEFVRHFTMAFFKEVPKLPLEVTIVYHVTSVEDVCFGVNSCNLSEHNTQCLLYLLKKNRHLPKVLICVDLIDLLTSVSRSPDFELISEDIQANLLKILIYLKYVSSIEEFKDTVKELLFLIFSPFENSSSLKTLSTLESKIKSTAICELYIEYANFKNNDMYHRIISDVEDFETSKVVFKYITDLEPSINVNLCKIKTPNPYYSETWYRTKLVFALSAFPAWTCLLNDSYDSVLIKNVSQIQIDDINSQKPIDTIFQFLETHIVQCDMQVERRRTLFNQKKLHNSKKKNDKQKKKTFDRIEHNLIHLDNEENWGGLNECYKEKELIEDNKCEKDEIVDETCDLPLQNDCNFDLENLESSVQVDEKSSNEFTYSSLPHCPLENSVLENSCVLAGSVMLTGIVNNNLSSMSETLGSAIDTPCKNSTPSTETNNNQSFILQASDTSTSLLLNNNINSDMKNEDDSSVDSDSIISKVSPKKLSLNHIDSHDKIIQHSSVISEAIVNNEESSTKLLRSKAQEAREKKASSSSAKRKQKKPAAADVKKKKYSGACPDMIRRHEHAVLCKSNGKDHLIRNGDGQEPRSINGMKYYLDNTSKYDALAEIFSFSCNKCTSFRSYCDGAVNVNCSNGCLLKLIKSFSEKNSIYTMYADRAILLYENAYRNEELSKISINADLDDFFCTIMLEHPSFKIINLCQTCNTGISYAHYAITVNAAAVTPLSKLQDCIMNFFKEILTSNDFFCNVCLQKYSLSLEMDGYLAVYLNEKVVDFVDSAPPIITLSDECEYMLIGVVTYLSDKNPVYVAHCRRPTGGWQVYNSKLKDVVYCKNLYHENIVLIIYVKV